MGKHCQIGELDNEGVKTLAKAASIATKLIQEALELDANTPSNEQRKEEGDQEQGDKQENGDKEKELQERDEVEEVCEETTEMNNEQRLHILAYKKFAGDKVTDIDKHICHSSFGDMMPAKQVLLKAVTSLLKKPLLNEFELSLYEQLSNQAGPTSTLLKLKGISEVSLGLMEEVIAIKDVDQMLSFIYEKKSQMAKQKKRLSEEFIMLSILERVVENFNLWDSSTKGSELTFYRRFAELLDLLFNGTDIKIADGETGSKSSKTTIEINKALFHTSNTSPTYPRKIDLLLKLNESTTVELSSSEWKKSSVSEAIILKQQTKNLKTNACILSTLHSLYGSQFKDVLAMDWIGNVGYLYRIEKDDQVFIASQIDSLIIPENVETFGLFKNTLKNLFKLKYFMTDTSALLKQELCKIEIKTKLTNIARNIIYINNNNESPYVFIPPAKKRKGSNASEQDDVNEQDDESE
ncbi:hypothetical protein G6F37_011420 [Rhizopus arrhizus]|nr:hypothetical protein G6F38_011504 [Rhizopus arrhizus]KAG1149412.1 hypothetical protein G6F37_011420 [Rhizopus arrhizus]